MEKSAGISKPVEILSWARNGIAANAAETDTAFLPNKGN